MNTLFRIRGTFHLLQKVMDLKYMWWVGWVREGEVRMMDDKSLRPQIPSLITGRLGV